MSQWVIAGDIGGRNIRISVFRVQDGPLRPLKSAEYETAKIGGLDELIADFLHGNADSVAAACFAVAGAVIGDAVQPGIVPFAASEAGLSEVLGGKPVRLINSAVALGYGVELLPESQFTTLNEGRPDSHGNRAVIVAGAGLSQSFMVRHGGHWIAVPSMGSHIEYSPMTKIEIDMLNYLSEIKSPVIWADLVSGPGLHNIYKFFRDSGRAPEPEPGAITRRFETEEPSMVITEQGMTGKNALCSIAMGRFVKLYGSAAGSLALMAQATDGIYVGGGIAPRMRHWLASGIFMQGFKRQYEAVQWLEHVPVWLVENPKATLFGAARCAFELLGEDDPEKWLPPLDDDLVKPGVLKSLTQLGEEAEREEAAAAGLKGEAERETGSTEATSEAADDDTEGSEDSVAAEIAEYTEMDETDEAETLSDELGAASGAASESASRAPRDPAATGPVIAPSSDVSEGEDDSITELILDDDDDFTFDSLKQYADSDDTDSGNPGPSPNTPQRS